MGRLDGKVAFITGAGSGIARAASRIFTREGAKVVIAELKPELGQAAEKLVSAAKAMATEPMALQLRYLQTLTEIGVEQNTTVVFPIPMNMFEGLMKHQGE